MQKTELILDSINTASILLLSILLIIQSTRLESLHKSHQDYTQFKCPDTSNPVSQTHINTETHQVTCSYQLTKPTPTKGATR